jgi:hypothetical protein
MFLGLETDNKWPRTELEQAARFQVIAAHYWKLGQPDYVPVYEPSYLELASSYYASARRLMGVEEDSYTTLFSPDDTKAIKEELDKASQRIMVL